LLTYFTYVLAYVQARTEVRSIIIRPNSLNKQGYGLNRKGIWKRSISLGYFMRYYEIPDSILRSITKLKLK